MRSKNMGREIHSLTGLRGLTVATAAVASVGLLASPAGAQSLQDLQQQNRLLTQQVQQLLNDLNKVQVQIDQIKTKPPMAKKVTRSGKKQVSLEVSGQVNRGVLFVDDGEDSETFFVDNDASSTRVRFVGKARLNPDISAGAQIEVEMESNSSGRVSIGNEDVARNFAERKLEFWVDSKSAGRLWVGQGDTASNGVSEQDLSGTSVSTGYSDVGTTAGSIVFRNEATGAASGTDVGDAFSHLDGFSRTDRVRYDTPNMAGFKASASVMSGDRWDVALAYAGGSSDFKVNAKVAYGRDSLGTKFDQYGGSASVLHSSGISLTLAAGERDFDNDTSSAPSVSFYYGKVGYQWKGNSLGKTALAVDYFYGEDQNTAGDESEAWGIWAVQKVDPLAMEVYGGVRWYSYDQPGTNFEDIVAGMVGARMKF